MQPVCSDGAGHLNGWDDNARLCVSVKIFDLL